MKKIIVIIVAVLSAGNVIAKDYFTFHLQNSYVYQSNELSVGFVYNLEGYKEGDFFVRPKIDRGNIEIYNKENNSWASQSDLWTSMPYIGNEMVVRISLEGETDMWFEIQNTKNQEIYETLKVKVWGGRLYGDYIDRVNQNLRYLNVDEEITVQVREETKPEEKLGFLAKMIKYIDEII